MHADGPTPVRVFTGQLYLGAGALHSTHTLHAYLSKPHDTDASPPARLDVTHCGAPALIDIPLQPRFTKLHALSLQLRGLTSANCTALMAVLRHVAPCDLRLEVDNQGMAFAPRSFLSMTQASALDLTGLRDVASLENLRLDFRGDDKVDLALPPSLKRLDIGLASIQVGFASSDFRT